MSTAVNMGQQNVMKTYSRVRHELQRKVTSKRLDIEDFPVTARVFCWLCLSCSLFVSGFVDIFGNSENESIM